MQKPGSVKFSSEEKDRLSEKHRIDVSETHDVSFREHKLAWLKVIAARAMGLVVTEAAGFLIGQSNKNQNKWLRNQTYEKYFSPKIENGLKAVVPGYKRLDNAKPVGNYPSGARHFADLLYTDTVLTAVSATTHKVVQGLLHKDKEDKDTYAERIAKRELPKEQPKDFRTRAENRADQSILLNNAL